MSLHIKNFVECLNSNLHISDILPIQTSVDQGYWVAIHPTSALTQLRVFDFDISGGGPAYFGFTETYLKVTASVVNTNNGDNLADDDEVAPVNNWMHAL